MKYEYETIKYNDNLPAKIKLCDETCEEIFTNYHWHKEIELICVIDGKAKIEKNSENFILEKGGVFLLNSGEIHKLSADCADTKILLLQLSYDFVKQFDAQLDAHNFVIKPESQAEQLIRQYLIELSDASLSSFQQYSLIMNILHVLFTYCLRERQISLYGNCKVSFRKAKLAMEYIEAHYREDINLSVMANIVGLNPVYFSKYFKDSTGQGFNAYLGSVRLKHAIDDLLNHGMTITDAASYNGFPNVKSFENACKRSYGITPLQFKKQQLRVS